MTEQPLFVTPEDWDIAVMHGQYSQGEDREDLVTFRRSDLAAYLAQMRVDHDGIIAVLRDLLRDAYQEFMGLPACKANAAIAKATGSTA